MVARPPGHRVCDFGEGGRRHHQRGVAICLGGAPRQRHRHHHRLRRQLHLDRHRAWGAQRGRVVSRVRHVHGLRGGDHAGTPCGGERSLGGVRCGGGGGGSRGGVARDSGGSPVERAQHWHERNQAEPRRRSGHQPSLAFVARCGGHSQFQERHRHPWGRAQREPILPRRH